MKTSFDISEQFEVAHSRIISLIDKLYEIEEYRCSYEIEEYKHIVKNNKREIRAYRMDDKFYILVVMHLPMDRRVMMSKWFIDAFFIMAQRIDTTKLNDTEFRQLSKLELESIEIDSDRESKIFTAELEGIFGKK